MILRLVRWFVDHLRSPRPATSNANKSKYARWADIPHEPDSAHIGHHRCRTMAPNVNYCHECEKHYRPHPI